MTRPPAPAPASFAVAPLDAYAERITSGIALLGGVTLLPALFLTLSGLLLRAGAVPGVLVSLAIAATLGTWLLLNYAAQPVEYVIDADRVLIRRRWWRRPLVVRFDRLVAVSTAGALADVPRSGVRQAFNAGVFGYHGPFTLSGLGRVFLSATHRERLVAIARHDGPPLLISPAQPRLFVDALRQALIDAATRGDR
jgi:hypothetical protein